MGKHYVFFNVAALLAAAAVSLHSCTSEIDMGGLDTNVTIGGDAMSLPVGSTARMTIGNYMNISEGDVIHVDGNGNYYMEFSQSFEQTVSVSDFTEQLTISGLTHELNPVSKVFPALEDLPDQQGDEVELNLDMDEKFVYEFSFEEAREKGLVSISRLNLENATLRPELRLVSELPLPESLRVQVTVDVPQRYVFEDSPIVDGQTVTFTGTFDVNGHAVFQPLVFEAIEFDSVDGQEQSFEFEDEFHVKDFFLYMSPEDLEALAGSSFIAYMVIKADSENGYLQPESFIGKIDIAIDPVNETIEINDVPDALKSDDVRLDFYNPRIIASLNSNSSVPINLGTDVVPEFPEGNGKAMHVDMSTPVSATPDVTETALYWISGEKPTDLDPEYEWIEGDVNGLLERIPESVGINVLAVTDSGKDALIECNADYKISGEFVFNVPFSFGEDLNLPLCDTLYGVPDILSVFVRSSDIVLSGNVSSTVPVDIELSACFLDSLLHRMEVPVSGQLVKSAGADLNPVVTPLDIKVSRTDIPDNIYALVLEFNLLSGETPGVPISEDSYIQADIVLEIPGGVTLDINE